MGDGYAGYESLAGLRPKIVNAGCWAHALRKFRDAIDEAPLEAVRAVTTIGALFAIERQAGVGASILRSGWDDVDPLALLMAQGR